MSWSLPVVRIFGSQIRVHITFLLLLAWIALAAYGRGGPPAAATSLIFVISIFLCVLAHEFGHALTARRYGIRTPDITLLPIGGIARLERMPEKPREEIMVALAGPAVNVVIALVLLALTGGRIDQQLMTAVADQRVGLLSQIASVNIVLALFNLIPAFPMDGGRVLRALLSTRMSRPRATHWSARIGQATAFVFGFLGLASGNVLLVFIAIFVYLAATAESQSVGLEDVARRVPLSEATITSFDSLPPDATLAAAADALLHTAQHEFPVVDGAGRLRGVVARSGMIAALRDKGPAGSVLDAMTTDIPVLPEGAPLHEAMRLLNETRAPAIGVEDRQGRFVGYLTMENIGELLMIDTARDRRRKSASVPRSGA